MPPKVTPTTPSASASNVEVPTMTSAEMEFLTLCLQNSVGGKVTIDVQAVMVASGLTNPGSVRNKVAKLAKKFKLLIGSGGAAAAKKGDA